jgi:hypothetical protein
MIYWILINFFQNVTVSSLADIFARTLALPFAGICLILLFFGIAAITTKRIINGVFAALFGGVIIYMIFPALIPISVLLTVMGASIATIAIYIIFGKHEKHKKEQ